MTFWQWLKQILPLSSGSFNKRFNSIENSLQNLEKNVEYLQKLSYYHLDPSLYAHALKMWYQDTTGNVLDLEDPKTYNEKIQWMKLYNKDPRKTVLADKLLVRDWIKDKIGEEHLLRLFAVYRKAEEIDFDSLPDSYVLKANHGSKMNYIVRSKKEENRADILACARKWLSQNYTFAYGYEMQYNDIPRRLLVEEYIENTDGDLPDYKFWCFDGKCKFIQLIKDRRKQPHAALYDLQWNRLQFTTGTYPLIDEDVPMPDAIPEMISIAEKLAAGFAHVRVDLFLLDNGEIKFGEMTFSTSSGTCNWTPPEADLWVGNMFNLPPKE